MHQKELVDLWQRREHSRIMFTLLGLAERYLPFGVIVLTEQAEANLKN